MSRAAWIQVFLFLHVGGAIAALGPTLTYGLWLRRAEPEGAAYRAFALRTIGWVDRRLATPAFILQAVTGTALILLLRVDFLRTGWLVVAVGIYAATMVFAITLYAPVVRRQVALAERIAAHPADEDARASYRDAARRALQFGVMAIALTVAILYLMVVKPTLWS